MTSIRAAISRFFDNNFKGFYLKKKTHFGDFWLHFWIVHKNYNILKKKQEYPSLIITEIIASERYVYFSV